MTHGEANYLKKYLIGLAVALSSMLVVQSGAFIWWASELTTTVHYLERNVEWSHDRITNVEERLNDR